MARICQHLAQPRSWRTTPCRLSATTLCNIFAATLHTEGRSSIRKPRTRHAVLTGTQLSWHSFPSSVDIFSRTPFGGGEGKNFFAGARTRSWRPCLWYSTERRKTSTSLVTKHAVKDTDRLLYGGLRSAVGRRRQEKECFWYICGGWRGNVRLATDLVLRLQQFSAMAFTAASVHWRPTSISVG